MEYTALRWKASDSARRYLTPCFPHDHDVHDRTNEDSDALAMLRMRDEGGIGGGSTLPQWKTPRPRTFRDTNLVRKDKC